MGVVYKAGDPWLQFGPRSSSGLGPGDVPVFPRDVSAQQIYAFDLQLPQFLFHSLQTWKRMQPALFGLTDHTQDPPLETPGRTVATFEKWKSAIG